MSSPIAIDIEAASQLSVARVENSVALVARLSLTNTTGAALANLTVELALQPDFSAKWIVYVSAIPPGGTFHLDTIELPLDRDCLVNQLERRRAKLMLWLRSGTGELPIATRSAAVDVLAYNEWSPRTVPHLLAAYTLPNHPAIAGLLSPPALVREQEKRWGSSNSKGKLRFNWRVMMAPMSLLDYVVAHDVCHLLVRDHSTRFWKLPGTILPDFEERRARLRVEGVAFHVFHV